jgi:hypothetical protein
MTIVQCERVVTYCNMDGVPRSVAEVESLHIVHTVLSTGNGYAEWIHNIPTGYQVALAYFGIQDFVVQPGPSSGCLHDITTTYRCATYITSNFQEFTGQPPVPATTVDWCSCVFTRIKFLSMLTVR